MSLKDTVRELLRKEPIWFEEKEYSTLVELDTDYQIQLANVMDSFLRGRALYEAVYILVKNNGILNPIKLWGNDVSKCSLPLPRVLYFQSIGGKAEKIWKRKNKMAL